MARSLKLALAESCTGGMIAQQVTAVPGSSAVFVGGVVCYANEVKRDILGVPQEVLERHGAVSQEVAVLLATNIRAMFGCDLAASVTGIAGPGGATGDKPVGLVYVTVLGPLGLRTQRHIFYGGRDLVRKQACATALTMLIEQTL